MNTTSAVAAAAPSTRRGPARIAAVPTTSAVTSRSTPPVAPPGHEIVAPCSPPKKSATCTNHRHGHPAIQASAAPAPSQIGARTAAAKPITVIITTTGSASTFAGTATRLTRPEMAATTGAVTRCAAAATATDSAMPSGTPRSRSAHAQPGASTSNAAVARTDIANEALAASVGCQSNSASTAADSDGSAARGRPVASDVSAIAPINAARRTLGDGRATITNITSTTPPSTAHNHGRARVRRSISSTAPTKIEQFVPLTATKCVRPASRNRSASTGSRFAVSPSTSPGNSPRSWSGSTATASRSAERIRPAARCHHGGLPSRCGGPCVNSVTDSVPPPRSGRRSPSIRTRCPGSTSRQGAASPSTSTDPLVDTECARNPTASAEVSTATRGEPATPRAASTLGSAVTVRVAVTDSCRPASNPSGDARACAMRPARGSSTNAMQNRTSARAAAPHHPRAAIRTRTATAPATPASVTVYPADRSTHHSTASHPAPAPLASRRSSASRSAAAAGRSIADFTPSPAGAASRT
jgi:hypothetical protein